MLYIVADGKYSAGPYIVEERVTEISTAGRIWTDNYEYDGDDLNKSVFLTREDAEKELARRLKDEQN